MCYNESSFLCPVVESGIIFLSGALLAKQADIVMVNEFDLIRLL